LDWSREIPKILAWGKKSVGAPTIQSKDHSRQLPTRLAMATAQHFQLKLIRDISFAFSLLFLIFGKRYIIGCHVSNIDTTIKGLTNSYERVVEVDEHGRTSGEFTPSKNGPARN